MSIHHDSGLSRRSFVKSLALAAAVPRLAWAGRAADTGTGFTRMFPLADIQLGEGVFAHSHALNRRYLAALEVDRLVAPYRIDIKGPGTFFLIAPYGHARAIRRGGMTTSSAVENRFATRVPPYDGCRQARGPGRRATRRVAG